MLEQRVVQELKELMKVMKIMGQLLHRFLRID